MRIARALLLVLLVVMSPAIAFAEATQIGAPAHAIDVALVARRSQLQLRAGTTTVPLALSPEGAALALESIALSGGSTIVLARVQSQERQVSVLLVESRGRVRAILNERTDLHGDIGERHATRIETRDRTGDGVADVVVGEVRENIRLCGRPPALLFARAVNRRR